VVTCEGEFIGSAREQRSFVGLNSLTKIFGPLWPVPAKGEGPFA
jgi:hypothetical protein